MVHFSLAVTTKSGHHCPGAVPRQVDSSNIKRSFSCCSPIRGELVTDFGSPQGLPFLIQELS